MLRLFQNIRPASALYVLLAGVIFRLPALITGMKIKGNYSIDILGGFFQTVNQNVMVSVLAGLFIVFIQAIIFNKLCIDNDVIYHHSYLPAYFFVICNSIYPENLLINPLMIVNMFMLFSLSFLFRLYQSSKSPVLLFYTALFFGCSSLFLPVFYIGIIFIIIGTIIFKNISFKDIMAILSGYLLPLYFVWGVSYLLSKEFILSKLNYTVDIAKFQFVNSYVVILIIFVICTAGILKTTVNFSKNNIKTRRISLLMIVNLLFALFLVLVKLSEFRFYFPLLSFSACILISYFMLGSRGKRWKELLNFGLIVAVMLSLYGDFLK